MVFGIPSSMAFQPVAMSQAQALATMASGAAPCCNNGQTGRNSNPDFMQSPLQGDPMRMMMQLMGMIMLLLMTMLSAILSRGLGAGGNPGGGGSASLFGEPGDFSSSGGVNGPGSTSGAPPINGPVNANGAANILPAQHMGMDSPWGAPRDGGRRSHKGNDFMAPRGTPVMSMMEGTVVDVGTDDTAGKMVTIRHPNGDYTRYFHLDGWNVQEGQQVRAGQQIGIVGDTGNARGNPHLHFEYHRGRLGNAVDPWPILKQLLGI